VETNRKFTALKVPRQCLLVPVVMLHWRENKSNVLKLSSCLTGFEHVGKD
jgi:hypothetical protein